MMMMFSAAFITFMGLLGYSTSSSSSSSFASSIIAAPSLILNVNSDIFEFMKTNEFDKAIADHISIKTLELQFQPPPPGATDYYFYIYNVTDSFITPRPWWSIVREPRSYDNNNYRVLLERVPEKIENAYRYIARKQFPTDCSHHMMHVHHFFGYGEYGKDTRGKLGEYFRLDTEYDLYDHCHCKSTISRPRVLSIL